MTLEQLRIFVAVAERQHMTRAADALNLTQQAVSSAIVTLENAYSTALFRRVSRRIELTETEIAVAAAEQGAAGAVGSKQHTKGEVDAFESGSRLRTHQQHSTSVRLEIDCRRDTGKAASGPESKAGRRGPAF